MQDEATHASVEMCKESDPSSLSWRTCHLAYFPNFLVRSPHLNSCNFCCRIFSKILFTLKYN